MAGVAVSDNPADIHSAFKSMLIDVRLSHSSKLDTALGKVLDSLLIFNQIGSEVAEATQVPGGKALFVAFGILLRTIKDYRDRKGVLAMLLTQVSDFLERFAIHERIDINSTWNHELYTRIFVNVLDVFALVTKIRKGKISKIFRGIGAAFLSNKDLKDASALLYRDIDAEARWTFVEVLAAVDSVHKDVSLRLDAAQAKLDYASSTLATTSAAVNSNAVALKANASTLNSNTIVLDSHTSALGTIHTNVLECVGLVRTARTIDGASHFGYSTSNAVVRRDKPSSTELALNRALPTDVDALTVVRDAMIVFQRFTLTHVTGEIRVPLACSIVLTLAMSPSLPICFRVMLANIISFFMWRQIMMPRRVLFTVTLITWASRVEVPLSEVRDAESYEITVRRIFCDPNCPEYEAMAMKHVAMPWHCGLQTHIFHESWTISPGMEMEVPIYSPHWVALEAARCKCLKHVLDAFEISFRLQLIFETREGMAPKAEKEEDDCRKEEAG
ncbi:hypothetical protein CYLTODRAFT_472643 [Cylindrobasidium torrendii FP15055 ss-10]|uniref:Fungal STAND N-terminal Goodbye domain-containing protein n=1 Tax=Cylindrobasidium torrendii FP15055 ss-10 TaxID=1314674 RepID=A0A0D7B0F4_9AGAR|nr:hypothetical protein CYLTODRAFT_472643 [Cylindrobasidium torrendii FP15055 ss-10]